MHFSPLLKPTHRAAARSYEKHVRKIQLKDADANLSAVNCAPPLVRHLPKRHVASDADLGFGCGERI